jgi:flagellar assembly protein FliH
MTKHKSFTVAELEEAQNWEPPFVDSADTTADLQRTNMFNHRSDWKYEPPEEVEEVKPPTAEEIEAIRQAAYDEGYAEGKAQGYEEGKAQGHEEGITTGHDEGFLKGQEEGLAAGAETIAQQVAIWEQLVGALHEPLAQVNEQLRQEIIKLSVALSRAVVRTEVKTNEDVILQALSEGLKVLPIDENQYQIHLNPEDIALLKRHFDADTLAEKQWQFVESPGLSRGGCDISTTNNAVDVSIESRTKAVLDKFLLQQGLPDDH